MATGNSKQTSNSRPDFGQATEVGSAESTTDGNIIKQAALWTTLIASSLSLAWSLFYGLDLSLWHDEVVTVVRYISKGPGEILYGSYIPNNHMLFSLVAWMATSLSSRSEVALRFWSVVPAATAICMTFTWVKARTGIASATTFLALVAVNPLLISVVRQARGYGMTSLFVVMMIGAAWHSTRLDSSAKRMWAVGIPAALAIFTLPLAALPFLALIPVLFMAHRWRSLWLGGGVALTSVLWYLGNLDGLVDNVGQHFGAPLPWYGVLTGPIESTLFPISRLLRPGLVDPFRPPPDPWDILAISTYVLVALAFWFGVRRLASVGSRLQAAAIWVPIFGTFLAFCVSRVWIEDRFALFLILPATALAAVGLVAIANGVATRILSKGTIWLLGAASALFLISLSIPVYQRLTTIPIEAFKDVAALVATTDGPVLTNTQRPPGLDYYIDKPLEIMTNDELAQASCRLAGTSYVVIDQPLAQPAPLDTNCLEGSNADLVRFRQLIRGDRIDVWIVEDGG